MGCTEAVAVGQNIRAVHHCESTTGDNLQKRLGIHTSDDYDFGVALPGGLNPPPVHGGYTGVPCTTPCPEPAQQKSCFDVCPLSSGGQSLSKPKTCFYALQHPKVLNNHPWPC